MYETKNFYCGNMFPFAIDENFLKSNGDGLENLVREMKHLTIN